MEMPLARLVWPEPEEEQDYPFDFWYLGGR